MRIQKAVILVIAGVFLTSLWTFGQTKDLPVQDAKALRALVKLPPGLKVEPNEVQKLADKIIEDNAYLTGNFGGKGFLEIAKRLGERGTSLLTHKYEKIWGKHSAEFWKDSWKEGATLKIVTSNIYITPVLGRKTVQRCASEPMTDKLVIQEATYNLVAVVTQEFHVIEGGAVVHNATSLGGQVYRHRVECVWE